MAEELGAWLGDPALVAILEPQDVAGLRAQRARPRRDRRTGRGARRVAIGRRQGPRRERPGAGPGDDRARRPAVGHPHPQAGRPDRPRPADRRAVRARLHARDRGRRPGRVRAARRHRRRVPAVGAPAGPDRAVRRRDRLPARLRPHRPTQRRRRPRGRPPARDRVPAAGRRRGRDPASGSAGWRARLPDRLAQDLERFAGDAAIGRQGRRGPRRCPPATPPRSGLALVAPTTGLDHLDPSTLLVLDEPGDLADAADFLWRQAEERHAEMVEAGDLPKDWPSAYLPPRDWKSHLHGARTLELTWQSEAGAAEGMAFASKSLTSGDQFGWREPVLPPGRTERLVDGVEHWVGEKARVVLASDQAPRLAELLGEAGHAVGIVHRVTEAAAARRHRPDRAQPQRRLRGRPRRPRAGHGPRAVRHASGSAGPRRCAASSRATSSSASRPATSSSTSTTASRATSRCSGAARRARSATTSSCRSRPATGSSSRSSRSTACRSYSGGEHPSLSRLGGTDWLRTKQRVRKAVNDLAEELLALYAKREAAEGFAVRAGLAVAVRDGGVVPVRGDARPAARGRRGQGRHADAPADGPAGRRRRRLRQDRGRAAGRVQGDPGRQAGRGARADDRARRPALPDVLASASRPSR